MIDGGMVRPSAAAVFKKLTDSGQGPSSKKREDAAAGRGLVPTFEVVARA
jgi:hypothetical protein